ncbi:MAG: branched-chain amino acid ABC transporter permease [Pigmentiphaga sp.]|nr:branched-chain amino acid ABC transporter permease [Pigmentiphaga sp.]
MGWEFWLQTLANGLVMGAIYALVAVGLALIFGVLDIVNFSHGELYMAGAMFTWFFAERLGLGYLASIPATLLLAVGMALLIFWLVRQTAGQIERSVIITLGVAMILQNGAMLIWTATPKEVVYEPLFGLVELGPIVMPKARLMVLAAAAACIAGLFLFLQNSHTGRTIRAVAQNPRAALMVGIRPNRAILIAVVLGIVLAAVAGILLAPVYSVHPMMGQGFIVKIFAIVIIGGLGSLVGAVAVAFALGIFESLMVMHVSMATVEVMTFAAMILVLLLRPQGLFSRTIRI